MFAGGEEKTVTDFGGSCPGAGINGPTRAPDTWPAGPDTPAFFQVFAGTPARPVQTTFLWAKPVKKFRACLSSCELFP